MLLSTSHLSPLAVHQVPTLPLAQDPLAQLTHTQEMLPETAADRAFSHKYNSGSVTGPGTAPSTVPQRTFCVMAKVLQCLLTPVWDTVIGGYPPEYVWWHSYSR